LALRQSTNSSCCLKRRAAIEWEKDFEIVLDGFGAAQAEFKGCYERVYDKAYLRKHKKQAVTKMRLQIGVGQGADGPFELLDRVDAVFRDASIYRGNLISCQAEGDELVCDIEGDGGSFVITDRGNKSLRITNKSGMRFGGADNKLDIKAKGDNVAFRLFRVSTDACR
jgi:predicted dehydrogenase